MRVSDWVVLTLQRERVVCQISRETGVALPAPFCSRDNLELHLWAVRCDFLTTDLGCAFELTNCLGDNWSLTLDGVNLVLKTVPGLKTRPHYIECETAISTQFVRFTSFFQGGQLAPAGRPTHPRKWANSLRGEFFNPYKMLGYRLPKLREYVAKKKGANSLRFSLLSFVSYLDHSLMYFVDMPGFSEKLLYCDSLHPWPSAVVINC